MGSLVDLILYRKQVMTSDSIKETEMGGMGHRRKRKGHKEVS